MQAELRERDPGEHVHGEGPQQVVVEDEDPQFGHGVESAREDQLDRVVLHVQVLEVLQPRKFLPGQCVQVVAVHIQPPEVQEVLKSVVLHGGDVVVAQVQQDEVLVIHKVRFADAVDLVISQEKLLHVGEPGLQISQAAHVPAVAVHLQPRPGDVVAAAAPGAGQAVGGGFVSGAAGRYRCRGSEFDLPVARDLCTSVRSRARGGMILLPVTLERSWQGARSEGLFLGRGRRETGIHSVFQRTQVLLGGFIEVFPLQSGGGFADHSADEGVFGNVFEPFFQGEQIAGAVPRVVLQQDLGNARDLLQDLLIGQRLQPVSPEVEVGDGHVLEHVGRQGADEIVVQNEHLQLVQVLEGPRVYIP